MYYLVLRFDDGEERNFDREDLERELADPNRVIEVILGQAGRAGLEAAGYEIRKKVL